MKVQSKNRNTFAVLASLSITLGLFFACTFFVTSANAASSHDMIVRTAAIVATGSATKTAVATGANQGAMYVKWDKIKVYAKRSKKSKVVATVKFDKKVTAISSVNKNGWIKVKLKNGKKGYALKKQLSPKKFKTRSLARIKSDWKTLESKLVELGWNVSYDVDSGFEWNSLINYYSHDSGASKEDYFLDVRHVARQNEDYHDCRWDEWCYYWGIYKDGERVAGPGADNVFEPTTASEIFKALAKF